MKSTSQRIRWDRCKTPAVGSMMTTAPSRIGSLAGINGMNGMIMNPLFPHMREARKLLLCAAVLAIVGSARAQNLAVARMKLPNGLTVLALEDHTVPSVATHI